MSEVKKKYEFVVIATDVVIFTIKDDKLQVLMMKMSKDPYKDCWAVPGGLVKPNESVDSAAKYHLNSKTGLKNIYLEQLYTFGDVGRDPFGRVVSVAYFALMPSDSVKTKEGIAWYDIEDLPKLAYDHKKIINVAVERLRSKLEYTNVVYSLLPNEFTLSEMQKAYEVILNREIDKRNFRKKIMSLKLVEKTSKSTVGGAHRPAVLYRFVKKAPQFVEIL